jgi:hypothetical protein
MMMMMMMMMVKYLTVHIIRKGTVNFLVGSVHIDLNYVINHLQMLTFLKHMSQLTLEIDLVTVFCVARLLLMSISSLNIYIYIAKRRHMYADYAISAFQTVMILGYIPKFTKKKGHTCARGILFRPIPACASTIIKEALYMYNKYATEPLLVQKS